MQKYAETELLTASTTSKPKAVITAETTPSSAPVAAGKVVSVTVSEAPSGLANKICSDMTFAALAGGLVILCFILLIVFLFLVSCDQKAQKQVCQACGKTCRKVENRKDRPPTFQITVRGKFLYLPFIMADTGLFL